MFTFYTVAAVCIIGYIMRRVYHFFYYKEYQNYTIPLENTFKSIEMYYFTSDETRLFMEYMAYERYQYQYDTYHRDFWCLKSNPTNCKILGCNCSQKILPCGCTICENILKDGYSRLPTYFNFGIDYYLCVQCIVDPYNNPYVTYTPNLMWDYNPKRGKQLKRYIIDRFVSNCVRDINMTIPSDINGVIQKFYGMDNRLKRRIDWDY